MHLKRFVLGLGLAALATAAAAQDRRPGYGPSITLAAAKKVTAGTIAECAKNQWNVAVAIVDPHGFLIYFERMEDTQYASNDIAIGKARTAAHFKRPTKFFEDQIKGGRPVMLALDDFTPLAGDRYYSEDAALVGGLGKFRGRAVMVIGNEKGSDTESRLKHNFGMAMPEGYRKAVRLMEMADKFSLPVITLVDTAGAYPGIGAEERGQAEAIARSTACCLRLGVPMISVIIGEGGSGGAVAIASANRILMLEHAIYSVISPEGAASIIWRDSAKKEEAATAMKITAPDLIGHGVIDSIVTEPVGGAHRDRARVIQATGDAIAKALAEFDGKTPDEIRAQRHERFLKIGRGL